MFIKWTLIKRTIGLLSTVLLCASASAQTGQLRDLAGRLEYGFYAADTRALQQDMQALDALQIETSDTGLRDQYRSYARWKLAERLMGSEPARAAELAEACAAAKPGPADYAQTAIHYALRAACTVVLEKLRPVRGVLYKREREAALLQARQLGGKLPQVQLIDAWIQIANSESDLALLHKLVAAYDAASIGVTDVGVFWGHAEACYLLGQAELQRKDLLAARNALERAVLLAPDYQAAQALLRSLSVK